MARRGIPLCAAGAAAIIALVVFSPSGCGLFTGLTPLTGSAFGVGNDSTIMRALYVDGSTLYAGGRFTKIDAATSAKAVAAWNGTSWTAFPFAANDPTVHTIGRVGTALVAGGFFDYLFSPTETIHHLVRQDSGGWGYIGGSADAPVNALLNIGGTLYAGGSFSAIGTVGADSVAQWNGTAWLPMYFGLNGPVYALTSYNNHLIAGGDFSTTANVARWNGATWESLGMSGVGGKVWGLTVWNDWLIVGGQFATAGGSPALNVAYFDGGGWHPMGDGLGGEPNAEVVCFATYNGALVAGGVFVKSGTTDVSNLARWDGSHWQPIGAGVNDRVFALANFQGSLICAGMFTEIDGKPCNHLGRFAP